MAEVARHGVKRKISALSLEDDIGSIVRRKLHHELKEVKKATKKAKDFEVRKIIKKLKHLRSKGADVSEIDDLEAQLVVLKHLEPEIVGNTAFRTKIWKSKPLRSNDHMGTAIDKEMGSNFLAPAQAGSAAFRVRNKLLSSRTLADEITSAVRALEVIISPQGVVENDAKSAPKRAKDTTSGQKLASDKITDESEVEAKIDGNVSEAEMGWESGSVEEATYNDSGDDATVDEEELQSSTTPKHTISSGNVKSSGLQSTFLPSLSVGFVRGDSDDSDWDESEAKIADPGKKKNRRGQRARQAIWEKKYGRNANHKKKVLEEQKQSMKTRHREKADNKRYDRDIHREHAGTIAKMRIDKKQDKASVSHTDDRPLHPSWEAKKRLKEKMAASIVPSQGKKIVF